MTYDEGVSVLADYRKWLIGGGYIDSEKIAKLYEALDVAIFALEKAVEKANNKQDWK